MRLVVFAYNLVGAKCLETLLDLNADIALVVTHADDTLEEVWFPSVHELALSKGLRVMMPESPRDPVLVEAIRQIQPEALFSFYYRKILGIDILGCATQGAFNLHGSLLPKYRGRCPVNWALINGEKETGVTLHKMIAKADAGDIVAQKRVPIEEKDTAYTLFGKIADAGADVMRDFYPRLLSGHIGSVAQDHAQATVFGGRRPQDGVFGWDRDARSIYNLVRAVTHPYPGAFVLVGGEKLFVWWALPREVEGVAQTAPGTILEVKKNAGVLVATGAGALLLKRVQAEGELEKAADIFAEERKWKAGVNLSS